MNSDLTTKLTSKITSLDTFYEVAGLVLHLLEDKGKVASLISETEGYSSYKIYKTKNDSREVYLRPVNTKLFIENQQELKRHYEQLKSCFQDIKQARSCSNDIKSKYEGFLSDNGIDKTLYTLQQAVGMGLDLFTPANFARKNMGLRFEDLIGVIWEELGITNKRSVVLKIKLPKLKEYPEEKDISYSQESDFILSPHKAVLSNSTLFDPNEITVSVKSSSKDRVAPVFLAKKFLSEQADYPIKAIAIFLNDVQRSGNLGISGTFVSNVFMIYTRLLNSLDGVYYLDPPKLIDTPPWSHEIKRFGELITTDLWKLGLGSR